MARVAETINNGKRLDRLIDETLADMAAKGAKSNVRKSVGGLPSGLMIQISPAGSASWILRTTFAGARREYGLGSYRRVGATSRELPQVSLSKARTEAERIVDAIGDGVDPVAARRAAQAHKMTFREAAKAYIAKERSGWRNPKHAAQWEATLERYAYPKIGDVPVEAVDLDAVEGVLIQPVDNKPLWLARHVTARRVRQRIETVLDYATAKKQRGPDNPARIVGPLARLLPKVDKQQKKAKHHASMPYAEAPSFMSELRTRGGTAAQALQFLIYTAARSGEVRNATWDQIDLREKLWTVPDSAMKAGVEHTVPLSAAAIVILKAIPQSRRDGLIFPGAKRGKPMSDMTLAAVLKRMGHESITVHGFRSTFRTWGDEQTAHSRNVLESSLAHTIGESDTERSYLRTKYLAARTELMREWADYLATEQVLWECMDGKS